MCCCCEKKTVQSDKAPKALGPYSIAVKAGDFVFTSGQVGIDPQTGAIVPGGIEAETRQVLNNLVVVLEAAGTSMANVVKTTVFLKDMGDFAVMNGIYGTYFTENPPARSAIQVAALPKGALVEIEAIAQAACECGDGEGAKGADCCCKEK